MRQRLIRLLQLPLLISPLLVMGCGRSPSFNVLGSYFPGWILCIVVAALGTSLLHLVIVHKRVEHHIPLLPLFYFCFSLFIACTVWLVLYE